MNSESIFDELQFQSDQTITFILPLTFPIQRTYICATQMALLGLFQEISFQAISQSLWLFHDSSLFTSPMTSIHAGARDNRHCEREFTWQGT